MRDTQNQLYTNRFLDQKALPRYFTLYSLHQTCVVCNIHHLSKNVILVPRVPSRRASRFFGKIVESRALKGKSQASKRAIVSHKRKHDEISRLDGMGNGVVKLQ